MGNCCKGQSENNLVNREGFLKEKAKNPGVIAKSDGVSQEEAVEGYKRNAMSGNGSVRTSVKSYSAVLRNEVHPVPVKTTMPPVHPGEEDPDGHWDSVKQDNRLQELTLGLPSTSSSDCQAKRAEIQECNRFGDDSHVNCSQPKEGNAVGSCEQIAEPNDENRPRLARTMDRTTPAMLSTSQDKATVRIGSEEHKVPVTSIMPEEDHSEEDLYRGEEEIEKERHAKDSTCPGSQSALASEDQCSVEEPVDLLTYSQREWRGNTSKSVLIRKGYEKISHEFDGLRRVRGDNYCALRATLFQLFTKSNQLPAWLENHDISLWPTEIPSEKDLVDQWKFPFENWSSTGGAVEQLGHYLKLLKKRWQEAVEARGPEEREALCQEVFQGREEEYGLLEALKFLMLRTAAQLHGASERGDAVPEFCCLLFARDSSRCPRSLLTNHLQHVGFSGGLEQVEMFLLGYSLQQTIQVYRLYKADTEEFATYYPDDHKEDWPHLCLLTEDDRHYNVPVPRTQKASKPNSSGKPLWLPPSGSTPMHGPPNQTGRTYV
ncbi:OTU deubiquitinase with linear linkage specificity b isoform X1 [Clupea harengus]|uniref:OTU deubiquitinase with linear linkage specificity b isoform X1 n=2 Tax=Clupea harengus TaxID=7950 RepID=A0A6P3W720_CLUHA|nr:OTU deubiquitinase with linear linkage specificity b isoform X1 [Clupea harengus]